MKFVQGSEDFPRKMSANPSRFEILIDTLRLQTKDNIQIIWI